MKYALVKVSNSSFSIASEWTDLDKAIVAFHQAAATLWNAKDVLTAEIKILDENLDCVNGYAEFIKHEPTTEE